MIDQITNTDDSPQAAVQDLSVQGFIDYTDTPTDIMQGADTEPVLTRSTLSKQLAKQILPYLKTWMKRSVMTSIEQSFQGRIPAKLVIKLDWLREQFKRKDAQAFFKKTYDNSQFNKEKCPEWPEGSYNLGEKDPDTNEYTQVITAEEALDNWVFMRAVMQATRHLNFGLQQRKRRYQMDATSDHKVSRTQFTGEQTWTPPTQITFSYWIVEGQDYSTPYSLEWIDDPEHEGSLCQIKVMKKVANVLKPKEGAKRKPEASVIATLLALKKGDSQSIRFPGEHQSFVEEQINSFCDHLNRISQEENIRFYMKTDPERPNVLHVFHMGRLYGDDNTAGVEQNSIAAAKPVSEEEQLEADLDKAIDKL